ncbi:uncharacterized protein LOC115622251 [Scaptodrosophila lebanonensis]|uniref:Ionotropic receptor 75a n=1 Tax=Drosophila lebanonensis TaxID=7225 RepID=A0A6J2T9L0_DROLE|nr:uncharacterized protein LOC115622251 [Scaptodrosophila lebanonensis]
MLQFPLFSFILYNLVQYKVQDVAVFHCWNSKTLEPLPHVLSRGPIYAQYINLDSSQAIDNFHKRYLDDKITKLGVFLDLGCENADYITNHSSSARLFTHHFHWLLYDELGDLAQLSELLGRANLGINADVTFVKLEQQEKEFTFYTLYDVYNPGSHLGGRLNITIDQTVKCNRSECEVAIYRSDLYKRARLQQRMDLSGVSIRLSALVTELPLNSSDQALLGFLSGEQSPHLDWVSRLGYHVLVHIQEVLHFNITYIWSDTWSVNDYIGGSIGALVNEQVDFITSPFVLSSNRLTYIRPLADLSQFRSICIFRTPHNAGIQATLFLSPFRPTVWFVFGGLLLLAGILLWLIFHMEARWLQRCLNFVPSLLTSCLISFGAACIQGSHLIPRSTGGRLAFIALMFTSFLMYNYYTSIVVSTLLGSPVRSNIKSIQQLADSSLDVGYEPIAYNKVYLKSTPRADIQSLVKQKFNTKQHDLSSIELIPVDGVLRVRDQPGFVFISEVSTIYYFMEKFYLPHEICELNEISFRSETTLYSIIHINSTYRELLKQVQVRMLESGIIIKHRRYYTKSKLHCLSSNYVINVGMEYAAPLFIALLLAYFLALMVLLLELAWNNYRKKKLSILGSESSTSFILNDLYNKGVHLGAKLNITRDQEIACNETKCHLKRYLSDLYKRSRFQQRKWLTGLTLRMTAVVSTLPLNTTPEAEIIEFLESISDIHIDSFARFGYQSRQALKDMLGCHFAYIFRDRWTSAEITGGLIGDLLNETADISVSPFIYTSARAPYFRALTQFSTFRSIGMFLNAPSGKLRSTEFLQPFSPSVWLMFGALLFVAGVLLWITFRLERQCSFNISLLTSCLISFGVACIQGAWLMPRSTGGRMAFYFLMLTSFMMYNYYTSIVVSTLLGKPAHSNIRTVQQLADSALDVSIETTPYVWGYVQTSGRPDIRSLYHNKVVKSNRPLEDILMAGEEGVLKVRNYPGHVFLAEATTAYEFVRKHFMPHQICALNEILLRAETATHTLVNKRSPYVELFKLSELRMMETGVQMKHERYWRRIKLHCYQSNVTVDVGLDYAAPLFLILLCAYIFCMSNKSVKVYMMPALQLANFLLYNLLQSRLSFIILFHCWPANETSLFVHQINKQQPLYMQFVSLNGDTRDWSDLEYRFFIHLEPTLAVYLDMNCNQSKAVLEQSSQDQLYNQHYHWLLHGNSTTFEFYKYFAPFNISVDADVTYVQERASLNNNITYTLYDVYNNGKLIGGQLNVTADRDLVCNVADCDTVRYLSSLHQRSKYANRNMLPDVLFRVSTVVTKRPHTWPAVKLIEFLNQNNDTHIDGIARFGFHILLILRDMLNCEMNFIFTDRWSTDDVTGGTVGAVISKEAEIGSSPSLATEGRLRYLSAIIETGYFRSVCMFRTPHNAGIRGDVFLQPFSTLVWFIFAGVLLMTGLLLWFTFNMEYKWLSQKLAFVPSLLSTMLIAFGAACIQSSALIPRSSGGRLAFFSLFLISFIMYNYYTSVVVSSLLSSPVKSKIKTLKQLAESGLPVGLEPLSFTKSYLNYSKLPEVHLFRKRKIETQTKNNQLWLPAEEGILRVRDNPGYVFVFESSSGYAYVERHYEPQEICDLNEVLFRPEQLLYTHLHRNSTYKELVRLKLLRVLETGVYRKQRNYWVHTQLHCFAQNFVIKVGMEYVAPLFFMLLCAYMVALLLLLLEKGYHRYMTRHSST